MAYAGYANNYVGAHLGWIDINPTTGRVYVVEFDTIIDEVFPANIEKLLDFRGHSYYVSRYAGSFRSKSFDDALQTAFDAGGYMHVVMPESEKIREAISDPT